jgi:hypothetical protein
MKKKGIQIIVVTIFLAYLKELNPSSTFLKVLSMHDKVMTINFKVLSFCTIGHNDIIVTISCKGLGNNKYLVSAWSKLHVYISI